MQVLLTELSPPSSPSCRLLELFLPLQQSFAHWSQGISLSATSGVLLGLLLLCQTISISLSRCPPVQCSCKCRTCPCWGNLTQLNSLFVCWFGGFVRVFFCFPGFSPLFLGDAVGFCVFAPARSQLTPEGAAAAKTNTLTGPVPAQETVWLSSEGAVPSLGWEQKDFLPQAWQG